MELRLDINRLTVGDMMALESRSLRTLHDVVIRFAIDEDGEPMSEDDASAILRAMTIPELTEWAGHIQSAVQDVAVPPETARDSRRGSKSGVRRHSG